MGILCCCKKNQDLENAENLPLAAIKEDKKPPEAFPDLDESKRLDRTLSDRKGSVILLNDKEIALYESVKPWNIFYSNLNSKFYMTIYIYYMEIWYNHCDSFGPVFQPFIEIAFGKNRVEKISVKEDDKLNVSNSSDILNTSTNTFATKNRFQSQNSFNFPLERNGNERNYHYGYLCEFDVSKEEFYNTLVFKVKNELFYKEEDNSNSNSKTNFAIIGDCRFPVHIIVSQNKPGAKIYEGELPIKQRETVHIGNLKVKISVAQSKADFDNIGNLLDSLERHSDADGMVNDKSELDLLNNLPLRLEDSPLHFFELDPKIITNIFSSPSEEAEQSKKTEQFLIENEALEFRKIDMDSLFNSYKKIKAENNYILAYEIFLTLFQMSKETKYTKSLIEFLIKTNAKVEYQIYLLPAASGNNYYFIKLVLMFLSNFIHNVKTQEDLAGKEVEMLVDQKLNNMIFDIIKTLDHLPLKAESLEKDILYQDNICWCLNVIMELLSLPRSIKKLANKELEIKEFTKIYELAIDLLSNRCYFISFAEKYIVNSEIVFSIVRMFRKIFQIVSDQDRVKEVKGNILLYKLKKVLITHEDGLFVNTLKKIILQYYHYPELFTNVLLILLEITHQTTSDDLACVFDKIGFRQLSKSFEIYRGKLKYINKDINQLYLELLANFSEMCKKQGFKNAYEKFQLDAVDGMSDVIVIFQDNLKLIASDLKLFYRMTKNYSDFRDKKTDFINIQEVISRIGTNITVFPKISFYLTDSYFFQDICEFLKQLGSRKSGKGKDFLSEVYEMNKKSMTMDQVKESIMLTLENNFLILIKCIFSDTHELGDAVYSIMGNSGNPKTLVDNCVEYLSSKGCITTTISSYRNVFFENINHEQIDHKDEHGNK